MATLVTISVGCVAILAQAQFDQAVRDFERQDYDGALARLEKTIRDGGDSARIRTLLGWTLYKQGELARARVELERALRVDAQDPNAFYAHEGLGWIAYKLGEHDRAAGAFAESLRLAPGYANAQTGLGWVRLAKRDLVRAAASFQAALAGKPDDLDARRGLALVAYHRGDWARAAVLLQEVLRANPGDAVSRSTLGWVHYYKGEYDRARPIFEELVRGEPTWADPLLGLAWIADRQGRPVDARAGIRAAIAKSARYTAGTEVRQLLAARPAWLEVWRELGWGLYHERAFAQAEAEFRALLARHPEDPDALRGLGYSLHALKRYGDALTPLRRSLASGAVLPPIQEKVEIQGATGLHSITSDAASTLAWAVYHLGDHQAALAQFRDVTRSHQDWVDPWSGLGWTLLKLGRAGEAEQAFRHSLAIRPGYPDAMAGLRALGRADR
ncbi:MAG: hypothetical protein A3F92_03530 [Candidatus Rokubacteria bacterium RIFCSPLOWO2_12_FULL_71_22]|nr:MAG: hypothetical protein A3F92_03530 [Candidatus Rokubacteria bacterium RIFCSPLOWO2_12_FULL_71_22]